MGKGIHVGDIGTPITLTVVDEDGTAIDISTASVKTYRVKDPEDTVTDKTASFDDDGVDGKLTYTTVDGDLETPGEYVIQVILTYPDTSKNHSSFYRMPVYENLEDPA